MKLSVWAKEQGVTYKTAHRLFKAGKLPNSLKDERYLNVKYLKQRAA